MTSRPSASHLVYSTDAGRMCPACRHPVAACQCHAARPVPAAQGRLRVQRETAGRGGKTVTVVRGLALDPVALSALGKQLRAACGCGGTSRDGVIEVQGDHVEKVGRLLRDRGFRL